MALQDPNVLAMVGLGTLDDSPENALQPKLVNAVHLRWAFRPDLGFPWHGFYLFRRNSKLERGNCLSTRLGGLQPGSMNVTAWASGIGHVVSDHVLLLRNEFPDVNLVEFDLKERGYLEFLPLEKAYAVDIRIGFQKTDEKRPRCIDFGGMRPQVLANPYERIGFALISQNREGTPNPLNEIVSVEVNGGHETSAFLLTERTAIKIDETVDLIDLWLVGPENLEVTAVDGVGNPVIADLIVTPATTVRQDRLKGPALHEIFVALKGFGYLLRICAEGADLSTITEIAVTARSGTAQVAQVVATGKPGDLVDVSLTSDAIDRIHIGSGLASLVELCWASALKDATSGWRPVEELKQPITLPVRHPDYPASGGLSTDLTASRVEAIGRVKYGDPNEWLVPFEELHAQCLNLVVGGPTVPMSSPNRAVTFPVEVEPGDTSTPPAVPRQHPLQLLLLAGTHAPIAQMIGLYWSDETATPGEIYDYLIVADHTGKAGGEVLKVLSQVESEGFSELDGYIVFEKQVESADPPEPPTDSRVFALSGATRPNLEGGVTDASCNAGLRWYLPLVNNFLLPDSPVLYHLWRVNYGSGEPSAPAEPIKFSALTPEDPLLIVENLLSISGVQRPQDWPPFPLYGFDNGVDEGWYGYRLSSVDLFGRHSALGPAARWYQWVPQPQPKPWYYIGPPADSICTPLCGWLAGQDSSSSPNGFRSIRAGSPRSLPPARRRLRRLVRDPFRRREDGGDRTSRSLELD